VAAAAEAQCHAHGTPITPQNCLISVSGDLRLGSEVLIQAGESLSSMQLLKAMLDGKSLPPELKALVATADDPLASFPSEDDGGGILRFDLGAFVRSNGASEIAQCAARAVAVEEQEAATFDIGRRQAEATPPPPATVTPPAETAPPIPAQRPAPVSTARRTRVVWNSPLRGIALGLAAAAGVSIGAVGTWLLGGVERGEPAAEHAASEHLVTVPASVVVAEAPLAGAPAAEGPAGRPEGINAPSPRTSALSTARQPSVAVGASTTGLPSGRSSGTAIVDIAPAASVRSPRRPPGSRLPAPAGARDTVATVVAPPVTLLPPGPAEPAPDPVGPVVSPGPPGSRQVPRLVSPGQRPNRASIRRKTEEWSRRYRYVATCRRRPGWTASRAGRTSSW
jgi:hypothetical protein